MYVTGTNIISSLGFDTESNFANARKGISGVKHYDAGTFDLPDAFMASLIDRRVLEECFADVTLCNQCLNNNDMKQLTILEKASILSILYANEEAGIDLAAPSTGLVFSTTKGNVDMLGSNIGSDTAPCLWHSAKAIARYLGNPNMPTIVSNACISGLAALITARRQLLGNEYDNIVVVGCDLLSKFIISGFQSFKALSTELCKPFDVERCGLNLGEAAATIVLSSNHRNPKSNKSLFRIVDGAIRNDATHISAPSRVGEGLSRALNCIMNGNNIKSGDIAFVSAHGTATPYNDSMEANALFNAGLGRLPVGSLKGYFGHTLGAAGILESIVSMKALENNMLLPTLNVLAVERLIINDNNFSLNVPTVITKTNRRYFIKTMSGFGGVNSAALYEKIANGDEFKSDC